METEQTPVAETPTETPARRSYTLRELRYRLQARLFSTLGEDERARYGERLGEMIAANEADVSPPGGWQGGPNAGRDTLLILLDGKLLGALVIASVPVLDPLVLDPEIQGNARKVIFEKIVSRAEGIAQGMGAAAYFFGVSPHVHEDFCTLLAGQEGTDEWKHDSVRFFRRLL